MNKKGFTLIEVLAVITILSIIGVIIVIKVGESVNTAKNTLSETQIKNIITATKKYVTENPDLLPDMVEGSDALISINELIENGIIENENVIDPKTKEKINGCVEITYNEDNNQYEYKYDPEDCTSTVNEEYTFEYTGEEQTFNAQRTGYYEIELWGASGGSYSNFQPEDSNVTTVYGGNGAYTSGIIGLEKNQKIYVYVGEEGTQQKNELGFNGGGAGNNTYGHSGSGGGATDIRLENGNWDNFSSLKTRIMVAAGGGAPYGYGYSGTGGAAGGLNGYKGTVGTITGNVEGHEGGIGATQTSGGTGGAGTNTNGHGPGNPGGFGIGGSNTYTYGSGAGSGYYGGGSGGANPGQGGAAGGGSSFISGHDGCDAIAESSTSNNIVHTEQSNHYSGYKFVNTVMIDGKGCIWTNQLTNNCPGMPTTDGTSTEMGHSGNGFAKITYLGKKIPNE